MANTATGCILEALRNSNVDSSTLKEIEEHISNIKPSSREEALSGVNDFLKSYEAKKMGAIKQARHTNNLVSQLEEWGKATDEETAKWKKKGWSYEKIQAKPKKGMRGLGIGSRDFGDGIVALLTNTSGYSAGFRNVELTARTNSSILKADMGDMSVDTKNTVFQYRTKKAKTINEEVLRGHFDLLNGTKDPKIREEFRQQAMTNGKIIKNAFDKGHDMAVKSGMPIAKAKEKYYMPVNNDVNKMLKYSKEEWVADLKRLNGVIDKEMSDEGIGYMFETITTNGLNKKIRRLEKGKGAGSLAPKVEAGMKHKLQQRYIEFNNADAYIEYHKKYGDMDSIVSNTSEKLDEIARDSAIVKILGVNPEKTLATLKNIAEAKKETSSQIDRIWSIVKGETTQTYIYNNDWANRFVKTIGGLRNLNVSSMLGQTVLMTPAEMMNQAATIKSIGGSSWAVWAKSVRLATSKKARAEANRYGMIADSILTSAGKSRFDDSVSAGWTSKMADMTLRLTGLPQITDNFQIGYKMVFLGTLEKHKKLSWQQMGQGKYKRIRDMYESYGIKKGNWEVIQKLPEDKNGIVDFRTVPDADTQAKILDMANGESTYAMLEPDARTSQWTTLGMKKGTIGGEVARTTMQFSAFPITYMYKHMTRSLKLGQKYGIATGAFYAGRTLLLTTIMGGVGMQLYNVASGKGFENMWSGDFWFRAILKGGGLSLIGNLILKDYTDPFETKGGSPTKSTLIDMAKILSHVFKASVGNFTEEEKKKEYNLSQKVWKTLKKHIPGQNIFYIKAIVDSASDGMLEWMNPKAYKSMMKKKKKVMHERGHDYLNLFKR